MVNPKKTTATDTATTNTASISNVHTRSKTAASTGAIPRPPNFNETLVERQDEEDLEASGSSFSANSTIATPPFSSMSARGIRDAFHQAQEPLRPPNRAANQNNSGVARTITHSDLRNLEDRVVHLVQQSLSAHSQQLEKQIEQLKPPARTGQGHNPHSFPDLSQPPPTFQTPYQQRPQNTATVNANRNCSSASDGTIPMAHSRSESSQGLRVEKWGIIFDGTEKTTSVEDFVFRVETLQASFRRDWEEVSGSFHLLLRGPAQEWFWVHRRLNDVSRWCDVKKALIEQFHRFDTDLDIHRKLLARRQQNQESFDDFYNAIMKLRNQLSDAMGEKDIVSILRGNLKGAMAQLLFSVPVTGLAQFCKECRRAENLLNNQRQTSGRYPGKDVLELNYNLPKEENILAVDALATTKKLICWNCRTEGHTFVDCLEEKQNIFCYKCGLENTMTPRCPNCQGNRGVNVSRMGMEARSKNPNPKPQQQNQQ